MTRDEVKCLLVDLVVDLSKTAAPRIMADYITSDDEERFLQDMLYELQHSGCIRASATLETALSAED